MILAGLCRCGCGGKTPLATATRRDKGHVKGRPVRFLPGHNMRVGKDMVALLARHRAEWTEAGIDYGECLCGCGERTQLAPQTSSLFGWVKDEPRRFCRGHSGHKYAPGETAKTVRWIEEDRGYDTPCWIWQLSIDRTGYARDQGRLAHRVQYGKAHGPLARGTHLDHLCRVRHCVNPAHLEPVTNAENSRRGLNAKLTAEDVREIRSLCAQGWQQGDIGRAYGITQANVSSIHLRKSWVDLV